MRLLQLHELRDLLTPEPATLGASELKQRQRGAFRAKVNVAGLVEAIARDGTLASSDLRFFLTLERGIGIFFDDKAPGHGGSPPRQFLTSVGAKRIQIPKLCTGLMQPADQSADNGVFKKKVARQIQVATEDELATAAAKGI